VTVGDGECLVVAAIGHEGEPLTTVLCSPSSGFRHRRSELHAFRHNLNDTTYVD